MVYEELIFGDCFKYMKLIPDNTIDAVVTDPPYGLKFMGKKWDYEIPRVNVWQEALRILKPGGYALVACGTRTQHRMAVNLEDAGFEIRDIVAWVYGSGFPKSLNVSKAIDDKLGIDRKVIGKRKHPTLKDKTKLTEIKSAVYTDNSEWQREWDITEPTSKEAKHYEGWGTALKPAMELITMARKPLSENTVAENVLKWGTGGINIDGCRVETEDGLNRGAYSGGERPHQFFNGGLYRKEKGQFKQPLGRFPANFIHDGDQLVLDLFPNNTGAFAPVKKGMSGRSKGIYGDFAQKGDDGETFRNDFGSAARFFYCAKASRSERNLGCKGLEEKPLLWSSRTKNPGSFQSENTNRSSQNNHPTVKPLKLMQYLIKLVSKENSIICDPYAGSGTTILACIIIDRQWIAMENDLSSYNIAKQRIEYIKMNKEKFK